MKRISMLLVAAFALLAFAGCSKEEENASTTIQLENNQISVDGQVYNVTVSLAQTGENFGARTTTIDFAVPTGEYSGSMNMTAVLENRQIDLVKPTSTVGNNMFDINIMDRTDGAPSPHLFAYYVTASEFVGFIGDSDIMEGGCFSSGWTKLTHDSQNMHYELSGILKDGRKVEIKLNIPESDMFYF